MTNQELRIESAKTHVVGLLQRVGLKRTADAIGITPASLTALMAGCRVTRGTIALVLEHQRLEAEASGSEVKGAA